LVTGICTRKPFNFSVEFTRRAVGCGVTHKVTKLVRILITAEENFLVSIRIFNGSVRRYDVVCIRGHGEVSLSSIVVIFNACIGRSDRFSLEIIGLGLGLVSWFSLVIQGCNILNHNFDLIGPCDKMVISTTKLSPAFAKFAGVTVCGVFAPENIGFHIVTLVVTFF
jgi:hypothetical protein